MRDLQGCSSGAAQVRLILDGLRSGTAADAVCWLPGSGAGVFQVSGDRALSAEWCEEFLRGHLMSGKVGSRLVSSRGGPAGESPSAALVCVSRSRAIWVLALRFPPRSPFQPADLKLMALARRVLLVHR